MFIKFFLTVDCEFSEWEDWESCSVTCGTGTQTRIRFVQTPASGGGRPCKEKRKERQPCVATVCPGEYF
jgi:hypothetical protein